MADWETLRAYIKNTYNVADESDGFMKLIFKFDDLRSQMVFVSRSGEVAGSEWAEIGTVVGTEEHLSAKDAMRRNTEMKCGALGMLDDGKILFFHRFPLKDLQTDEFEGPFHLVITYGDVLEKELTGRDAF